MQIGEPQRIYEIPEPETVPDHAPGAQPDAEPAGVPDRRDPSPPNAGHRDEPGHGWKLALLFKDARNITFRAVTRHAFYPAGRQRFSCYCPDAQFPPVTQAPHRRLAAGDGSSCGWYAMKDQRDCLQAYRTHVARNQAGMNAWLLEVDLWGTVIEGEHGYPGEYQRVLSVRPAGPPELTVTQQNQLFVSGTRILYRPVSLGITVPPMQPVLRVADLAARLGTEVLWSDTATQSQARRDRLPQRRWRRRVSRLMLTIR